MASNQMPARHMRSAEGTIGGMQVGDGEYIVPWELYVDRSGCTWLNPEYPLGAEAGADKEVRVWRTHEGYHVEILPACSYLWRVTGDTRLHESPMIPVFELHDLLPPGRMPPEEG
jgi:hypothetical protein